MNDQTGWTAFPQCSYNAKGGYDIAGGMTLRDYFAAAALQGMLANSSCRAVLKDISSDAYDMADVMLEARKK